MRRFLTIALVLLTAATSGFAQECSIFYVTPNGAGSGTKASPTSLQNALASVAPGTDHIRMAAGDYPISAPLNLISNVTLEGGFDPTTWIKSNNTVTRIVRDNTNVEPFPARLVAISAINISGFHLHDLTVVVEDAVGNGVTTYGVHISGCSDYSLSRIKATAGSGSNGVDGLAGVDGANGAPGQDGQDGNNFCPNGSSCEGIAGGDNNTGGAGGNSWSAGAAAGGNGGDGGQKGTSGSLFGGSGNGYNGNAGQNGNGNSPGVAGNAGDRWRNTASGPCGIGCFISLLQNCGNGVPSNGTPGTNAAPPGANGLNGLDGIPTHDGTWFIPGDGEDGGDGENGSGGGGGGGGGSYGERLSNVFGQGSGAGGGGGGEGGQGGTGAGGGLGGGGSFGIYITNNGTGGVLNDCVANSGFAGIGGVGGFPGGLGGQGGVGGWGGQLCSQGGQGGNGSKGGNGGFGGNGGPGVSQPIYEDPLGIQTVKTSLAANVEPHIFLESTACTYSDIYYSTSANGIIEWFYEGSTVPQNNIGQSAIAQYTGMGQFDMTMVTNGVPYFLSEFVSITIDGQPYLPTIQASDDTICPGDAVNFSANWPTNFNVLDYRWDFGDPTSGSNTSSSSAPTHTYDNVGRYMVTLQTESPCCGWSKPDTFYIDVMPPVTPQVFITATTTEICEGESITFGAIPVAGGDAPTYQWFQNGVPSGTGNSFTPNPINDGDAIHVRMTSSYPCPTSPNVDSETIIVIVHPNPVVDCSNVTNSYLGANTGFNADVTVGTAPYIYFWQFGDGGVSDLQNPTHLYGGTGQYPVSVEVTDTFGCSAICDVVVDIILPPYVHAGFEYAANMECGSTTVQFTDTSQGLPTDWEWRFGDSIVSGVADPQFVFTGPGPFTVTLVANNGVFWDTLIAPNLIDVMTVPVADFIPSDTEVCDSSSIRFYDNSVDAAHWEWNFDDPNSAPEDNISDLQNPFHEFNDPGTYNVTLTVYSDDMCPADATPITITVHRSPVAGYEVDSTIVCATLPIAFYDTSKADVDITGWFYHFSDKDTLIDFMNQDEFYYTFDEPGWYWVTQYVENRVTGCRDSVSMLFEVRPHPVADFYPEFSPLYLPDSAMQFFNTSSNVVPDSSWWDFGNGYTVDYEFDAIGLFPDSGLFDVQLIVMRELGCPDTVIVPFRVWEQETFFIQTAFTPNGDGYNDELEIKQKGITDWHMVIYDRWGKLVWETFDVNNFWDGRHMASGKEVQQGAYAYTIQLSWYTGKTFSKMGTITIIR